MEGLNLGILWHLIEKDNFMSWRNLYYHSIELKDIFIHKIW